MQEEEIEFSEQIKVYESLKEKPSLQRFFCFNPYCKNPISRVFHQDSSHLQDRKCIRWIVTLQDLSGTPSLQENTEIEFRKTPMKNLIMMSKLRDPLNYKLREMIEKMRKGIEESLNAVQSILKLKINEIVTPAEKLMNNFQQLLDEIKPAESNEMLSFKIQELMRRTQIKQICQTQSVFFMPPTLIKEATFKIQEKIENLVDLFLCPKEELYPDIALNTFEQNAIYEYVMNEAEDHQRMVQKYTSLLKVHPKKVYEKNTRDKIYRNKCPYCSHTVERPFSQGKDLKSSWEELSEHLYDEHFDQLSNHYSLNISKKAIKEITLVQLLYLIKNYSYERVHLIFKACRKFVENKNLSHKDLAIEVIYSKSSDAPSHTSRYISITDHSELSILFCLIGQAAAEKQNKPFAYIYSPKVQTEKWKQVFYRFGLNETIKCVDENLNETVVKNNNILNESMMVDRMEEECHSGSRQKSFYYEESKFL